MVTIRHSCGVSFPKARSKLQRIAKRSATGNCSARNALSLLQLGRIGALVRGCGTKREYEKLQFVELKRADFTLDAIPVRLQPLR